jgi:hypothetical protein
MPRIARLLLAAVLLTVPAVVRAAEEKPPAGNWKVTLPLLAAGPQPLALVHLEEKEGKWTGKLLDMARNFEAFTLDRVQVTRDTLRLRANLGDDSLDFELRLPPDKEGRLRGSVHLGRTVQPAELEQTTITSLKPLELDKELLSKQTQGVPVIRAGMGLLAQAAKQKAKPEEVRSWAAKAARAAQDYGSDWHREILLGICEILLEQKGFESVALPYARQAERMLTPKDRLSLRKRTLELLAKVLEQSGKADEAKAVEARLGKIDCAIKPVPFAGRKSKSERAVLVELFVSSQEPTCVAPELALPALGKTFKPSEAILLQYHLNPRAGDPLSNAGGFSRLEYYASGEIPSALFDGRERVVGGGGQEDAVERYESYVEAVSKRLDRPAQAKIEAAPERDGDKVSVKVRVSDVTGGGKLRLRVALVEEAVAYTGRSKVAQHHHVVRAFLGGAEGTALGKEKEFSKTLSIDLGKLRKELKGYLDEAAREAPFPDKKRPMELSKLRIVAFVQNDETREVLQAVQAEVPGGKGAKNEGK